MAAERRAGPTRSEEGGAVVDATLIDALAPLTPEERLRWNDRRVNAILAAVEEIRRARGP